MDGAMAVAAQDDEVCLCVWPSLAASNDVVYLQLIAPTTVLAAPSVPLENAMLELAVRGIIEA